MLAAPAWAVALVALLPVGSVGALAPRADEPGSWAAEDTGPMDDLLGDPGREVRLATFTASGTVERVTTAGALAAALRGTSFGGSEADGPAPAWQCHVHGRPIYCGPDAGDAPMHQSGFFCDNSSGWVVYRASRVAAAVVRAVPGSGPVPPICGGWFGPTVYWEDVVLSATRDPEVFASVACGGYEGAYSTRWSVHSDGHAPNPWSGLDTFLRHWRGHGPGVLFQATMGNQQLTYFIGLGATTSYDLPLDAADEAGGVGTTLLEPCGTGGPTTFDCGGALAPGGGAGSDGPVEQPDPAAAFDRLVAAVKEKLGKAVKDWWADLSPSTRRTAVAAGATACCAALASGKLPEAARRADEATGNWLRIQDTLRDVPVRTPALPMGEGTTLHGEAGLDVLGRGVRSFGLHLVHEPTENARVVLLGECVDRGRGEWETRVMLQFEYRF